MKRIKIKPIGTNTPFGKVVAIGRTLGERYYWLISKSKVVSMMPASVVEGPNN